MLCVFLFPFLFQKLSGQATPTSICSPEHTFYPNKNGGSTYLFVQKLLTADEANLYCRSLGSELVQIPDFSTFSKLKQLSLDIFHKYDRPEALITFYAFSANNFAYRYESPINPLLRYDQTTNQFNDGVIQDGKYYPVTSKKRLRALRMHRKPTGDFSVPYSFCSHKYDIVVSGTKCPEQYKKSFEVYASFDPSSTENKILIYAPTFVGGDIVSTPLMTDVLEQNHLLSYDAPRFYVPDYRIFVGARSRKHAHTWVWNNGEIMENTGYFVPFPDPRKCQQLAIPINYEDGENFKIHSCSGQRAYPVCEFNIVGDYRQTNCQATHVKLLWRTTKTNPSQHSLDLKYILKTTTGVKYTEENTYSFAEFNTVMTIRSKDQEYDVSMSLSYPPRECNNIGTLSVSSFRMNISRINFPPTSPQATVRSLSTVIHFCHFKIRIPDEVSVLKWKITVGKRVVLTVENNFNRNRQFAEVSADLTENKITTKNPIFSIRAISCYSFKVSKVSGSCNLPLGQTEENVEEITKVLKPLKVKSMSANSLKTYLLLCSTSIICGLISGFLYTFCHHKMRQCQNLLKFGNTKENAEPKTG